MASTSTAKPLSISCCHRALALSLALLLPGEDGNMPPAWSVAPSARMISSLCSNRRLATARNSTSVT